MVGRDADRNSRRMPKQTAAAPKKCRHDQERAIDGAEGAPAGVTVDHGREPASKRGIAKHDERSEMNADDHAERVERLREVQPKMAALRRAKLGRQRIGRNLKSREARRRARTERQGSAGSRLTSVLNTTSRQPQDHQRRASPGSCRPRRSGCVSQAAGSDSRP